jgi:hypothetical protein
MILNDKKMCDKICIRTTKKLIKEKKHDLK